jgi:hypothetical protein
MARKILFVTTDQQRYDTLGCNGGTLARTPVVDGLASSGHPLRAGRAPVGGLHAVALDDAHRPAPGTHGVWMNGVPLPVDAPSVATCCTVPATAPAHRQGPLRAVPGPARPLQREPPVGPGGPDRRLAPQFDGLPGPHRGFEHLQFATHGATGWLHYAQWLGAPTTPRRCGLLPGARRRPRGQRRGLRRHRRTAGQAQPDPEGVVPHRLGGAAHDRLARRARGRGRRLVLLDELPRPAPSVGPPSPSSTGSTGATFPSPTGTRESAAERERLLDAKPRHWRLWYDGELVSNYEAPPTGCRRR